MSAAGLPSIVWLVICLNANIVTATSNRTLENDVILLVSTTGQPGLIYDPNADSQLQADNFGFQDSSSGSPATSSCNGHLYITYGTNMTIWDSATNKSHRIPNLLQNGRRDHSMSCVNKGADLLICGGSSTPDAKLTYHSCELCHMSVGTPLCVSVSDMPAHRRYHTAVTVSDTKMLIVGGWDDDGFAMNTVYQYDIQDDYWDEDLPLMKHFRSYYPGVVMLDSHRVFVSGGLNADGEALSSCEVLDLNRYWLGWTPIDQMKQQRYMFGMVHMGDGLVYAIGGLNTAGARTLSVEICHPDYSWTYAKKNLTETTDTYTAVRLQPLTLEHL